MSEKRPEFLKGLAHLMECDAQKVVPEAKLESLGPWDSLNVMQTVVLIDEVYGKIIHGGQISECVTVEDVLKVAES